ncbi:nitroreductase family protein [Peptoniphilus catoniae]|uniref:nitroreductase family protein n=1 Tax=Peptoniphilus catoniae TaxID=1660341 RepID=UPI0010FDD953|nr:nitroreductase family protein [Peptoniphilus catoniae]
MNSKALEVIKARRSFYDLDKNVDIAKEDIGDYIKEVVHNCPSSYNGQSQRAVVLFGDDHDYLWGKIVMETLRKKVNDEEDFKKTEKKINGFKNAFGTVLIFEDQASNRELKEKYPNYADNVDPWSEQNSGIVTLALWISLRDIGLGANLQHYNPIIDKEVKEKWNINDSWTLKSQMVFGNILSHPAEKKKKPIDERVIIK